MPTVLTDEQIRQGCKILANGNIGCPRPITTTQEKIDINNGNVTYKSGQTTLDKILATVLSAAALAKGAGYIPTTTIPQQQQQDYSQYQYQQQQQQ